MRCPDKNFVNGSCRKEETRVPGYPCWTAECATCGKRVVYSRRTGRTRPHAMPPDPTERAPRP